MKKYFAGKNAPFSDEKADLYGKELEKIQIRNNGIVTPDEVVHTAKSKSNPLHSYFNWDDKNAAHNYRKTQARRLMRVIVVRESIEDDSVEMPAFTSVKVETKTETEVSQVRVYMPESAIRNDVDLHNQVVMDAYKRLMFWKNRFGTLKEMQPVVNAIEQLELVAG